MVSEAVGTGGGIRRPVELAVETTRGPACAVAYLPVGRRPNALVVALHGAGTDSARSPLPELCGLLAGRGIAAVRFDQPYVVAGRKAPDAAHFLDRTLLEALRDLRGLATKGARLGLVGRSSGARVACRVAAETAAAAIACLGFPFQPPARKGAAPPQNRGAELAAAAAACPVLVVQGSRDPFGMPPAATGAAIVVREGVGHVPTVEMAREAAGWLTDRLTSEG